MTEPKIHTLKTGMVLAAHPEWTTKHIADFAGVTEATVRAVYKRHGIDRPRNGGNPSRPGRTRSETSGDQIVKKYGLAKTYFRRNSLQSFLAQPEEIRQRYAGDVQGQIDEDNLRSRRGNHNGRWSRNGTRDHRSIAVQE